MKKILSLITILLTFFIGLQYAEANTASTRLTASKTSIQTTKTATVQVRIDASNNIRGGQFNLTLNNNNFEIVSVTGANGLSISTNGSLYLAYRVESGYSIPSGSSIATITVKAKSSTTGASSVLTVSNVGVTLLGAYETVSAGSKAVTLTVAATPIPTPIVPKSSNNNLSTLTSTTSTFTFNPNITTYNVTVPSNVTTFDINAVASDSKANVNVSGNTNLVTGNNVVNVTVTAENGTVKTYTINVLKESATNNYLASLKIKGYELDKDFDKETNKYNITIKDKKTKSLDIEAIAEDPKATIEIIGNEDLMEGRNIIKVVVTSEKGEENTYNLVVNIASDDDKELKEEKTLNTFMIITIIIIIIIVVGGLIATYKPKENN